MLARAFEVCGNGPPLAKEGISAADNSVLARLLVLKAEHAAKHAASVPSVLIGDKSLPSFRDAQKATKEAEAELHAAMATTVCLQHRAANLAAELVKANESLQNANIRVDRAKASLEATRGVMDDAAARERDSKKPLPKASIEEVLDDDTDDNAIEANIAALRETLARRKLLRERVSANLGAASTAKRTVEQALAVSSKAAPVLDRDGDAAFIDAADAAEAAEDAAAEQPCKTSRRT
jgi:hypothetical protein